ncbi:MAG: hypothetical protein LBF97_00460, partial [Elusimicrobiota bacterium]|nr:hypothetical protein [Elusimicrobiota bacterium]
MLAHPFCRIFFYTVSFEISLTAEGFACPLELTLKLGLCLPKIEKPHFSFDTCRFAFYLSSALVSNS